MRPIKSVPKINSITRQQLARADIRTVEALWRSVGMERDGAHKDLEKGIADLAGKTRIPEEDLIKALAFGAQSHGINRPFGYWLSRTVLVALALAFVWHVATEFVPRVQGYPTAIRSVRAQVVAAADLPAYHVITPSDIKVVRNTAHPRAVTESDALIGTYTLRPVASGQTISMDHVSSVALADVDLEGTETIHIPTTYVTLPPSVEVGRSFDLLLVLPGSNGEPGTAYRVTGRLLDAHAADSGQIISVAVRADDVSHIQSMLPGAEIFLVQPR